MSLYAVISPSNAVINLVTWDGVTPFDVTPNTLVSASGQPNAQIGGTYANGVFTAPSAPTPPQGIVFQNSPVSGATVALPSAYSPGAGFRKLYVYLQPAAALAALTLSLDSTAQDGDVVYIVSTKAITALTLAPTPANGGATAALGAGVFSQLEYSAQLAFWYRIK
jgi:hypothetical protein